MNQEFEKLLNRLTLNDPSTDEARLYHAYEFCMKAHGPQLRVSGDPYYTHPLAVAQILADMGLDESTVITGLLHDTVEDTLTTLEGIEKNFGTDVAKLVDGVTKLSQLELQSEHTKQAENFRKLVLAMSTDIRVLLVKLADRLHNMQTLHYVTVEEKRKRIARETIEIYAPLAERMGMQYLKDELEDTAFNVLNPEIRNSVRNRLDFIYENADYTVGSIADDLQRVLQEAGLPHAQVNGRHKTPYSVWKKMQDKRASFEQLADVMAFRIIVATVPEIYKVLGVLHTAYRVLPGRFKDYVSTPKLNGYQSLHTGVMGPFSRRIEIQIRTEEMHCAAEYGIASHWQYKQPGTGSHDGRQYAWLRGLLDILDQTSNPEEFLENTKLEMFHDQVFCFTPKGDLIQLPSGATPVDFAYAVHSEVGNHLTGAKINGRLMPLRTRLHNGDQVEAITSTSQNPSPTWEQFVITGKARSHIRRFIRQQSRDQFAKLGRSILQRIFQQGQLEMSEKILRPILAEVDQETVEDLYVNVGKGILSAQDVLYAVYPEEKAKYLDAKTKKRKVLDFSHEEGISIQGLIDGMAVRHAGCCHPLPGDPIAGIVKTGKGIVVHTRDCEVLKAFSDPDRILDLNWGPSDEKDPKFIAQLKVTFLNRAGSLSALSTAIFQQKVNITDLKVTNRTTDFWELTIDVEVKDVEQLNSTIGSLQLLPIINVVERS
jgi:GTP diphosphokinase / guanosine-3',5'-bis(diphosphate) 3'-diphosphatase